jgi:L-aminopeptidase/D-esterase-like protein
VQEDTICDVDGVAVGHYTDPVAVTGCSVILLGSGAIAGVDVRGAAPGTRETDLLRPGMQVERVHAILLTGGSAYGLAAADGVMRHLESRGIGYQTAAGVVPIVPAAVIFDLSVGQASIRPDAAAGAAACEVATTAPVSMGSVGAGTGALVGKILGPRFATRGGLGSASVQLDVRTTVGALVVVNAGGNVVDSVSGRVVAGVRRADGAGYEDAEALILASRGVRQLPATNTTLAVLATNAPLDKSMANRLAQVAHDGLARALRPVHTMFDGDTVFAVSTAGAEASSVDFNRLAIAATLAVERSIVRAVERATSLPGFLAARDYAPSS